MPPTPSPLEKALTAHQSGDLAEATRIYREILAAEPQHPDALHMMGIIARQKGNNDLALKLIEGALAKRMAMPLAWYNRSVILRILNRNEEALQSAEQAVYFDPNMAEAWDMAGYLLREKKEFERARTYHAQAVALEPENLKFLSNYAMLLQVTGELAEAYAVMSKIERRNADGLLHTMGNVLIAAGYPDRAISYFQQSRQLVKDNRDLSGSEAMARLQSGDFEEGWRIWEMRRDLNDKFISIPMWNGAPINHLLLHEDQGLGDTLQCVRYIADLRKLAKNISFQGPHFLKELITYSYPDITYVTDEEPIPAADARIRLLSLPAIFKTNSKNILPRVPYIKVREDWRPQWRDRLASIPKPHIGIVWGGNPNHMNDRLRSIPFADFAPIIEIGKSHIISLQKGGHREKVDLSGTEIFDADPFLNDFTNTAGLMAELDLLISVDTATVHLAGAMGIPTWLLLPFDPDWRWLLAREDSPWYPSVRIFRQHTPRTWPEVITRVTTELNKFLSGNIGVLKPKRWEGKNARHNPHAIALPEAT
jgi:Flp pilus assembly protein TadD